MIKLDFGFLKYIRPFVITLLGTLVSGFIYIFIFKGLTMFVHVAKNPAFTYLMVVVFVTAIANAVLASVLYFPLRAALGRR
jgi:hypothetical protein